MVKLLTAQQIRQADAYTIRHGAITSLALMERAAQACFQWISRHFSAADRFFVFCGKGNNGGDGLALTRILLQEGYRAAAIVVDTGSRFSEDAQHNLQTLQQLSPGSILFAGKATDLPSIPGDAVLVDALFGIGLNRPLTGLPAEVIGEINAFPNKKIAIDMPSGLLADRLPGREEVIFKADHTLSFRFYKRSFLHPESAPFSGEVHVLDIDPDGGFIDSPEVTNFVITPEAAAALYRPPPGFGHKGTFGKAQLVGGSYGKIGAIALSTLAALRSGAGLVFVTAPQCGYEILQTLAPEAMFSDFGEKEITYLEKIEDAVIGIGPGLGTQPGAVACISDLLKKSSQPMVLDADALNVLSQNKDLLAFLPAQSVITPHPKEFDRLFGDCADSLDRVERARAKAIAHQCVIVLKGHHTAVLDPGGSCRYNMNGNPGMATGGSGDVLTGIITALLARGYPTADAASLGVYLHGYSGDLAARSLSCESLVARDLIDFLGKAFLSLYRR